MVNRGRPSKDCAPCRKRKLRCDLHRPECGQCQRAHLPCFGYRNPEDLIFHDQTNSIRTKAQRSIPKPPRPSWTLIARHDFLTHYVSGLSRSYDMLGPLYKATRQGSHLDVSVDAASLAFMAVRHTNASNLLHLAAERYVTALQLVNKALTTPDLAVGDDTLLAVLLLDLYEKLVCRDAHSATSWLRHMKGAIALIELRGERNLSTGIGRRLAQRLYTCLVISCGVAGVRVPPELDHLKQSLDLYEQDPKWGVTTLNVHAINLVAGINEMDPGEIVTQATRLDEQFRKLQASLPPKWHPKRILRHESAVNDSFIHGYGYDVYDNLFYTQVWNVIRIMRIHLHILTQQHSHSLEAQTTCTQFIETSINEICASATQFLTTDTSSSKGFSLPQSLQCYTLLPPLYLAGSVSCTPSTRTWVLSTLQYMAHTGGLEMAHRTAQLLQTPTTFWDLYALLGSYAFAA